VLRRSAVARPCFMIAKSSFCDSFGDILAESAE
jgi:hypothetical protein